MNYQKIADIEFNTMGDLAKDPLGRGAHAKSFAKLFASMKNDAAVISLESPWGTGKTTFLKMLECCLREEQQIDVIRFNAWENDFTNNPFWALAYQIHENFLTKIKTSKEEKESFLLAALTVAGIAGSTAVIAFMYSTALPALGAIAKVMQWLLKKYNNLFKKPEGFIRAFSDIKQARAQVKESLASIIKNANRPLIILIDELDRCRPDYAVTLLEDIKHLFSIKGITFVLAVDREQLSKIANHAYGVDDGDGYLSKFIDIRLNLPVPDINDYAGFLFASMKVEDGLPLWNRTVVLWASAYDLSLRKVRQVCEHAALVIKYVKTENALQVENDLIVTLCFLRLLEPKVYYDYCHKQLNWDVFVQRLRDGNPGRKLSWDRHSELVAKIKLAAEIEHDISMIRFGSPNAANNIAKEILARHDAQERTCVGHITDLYKRIEIFGIDKPSSE